MINGYYFITDSVLSRESSISDVENAIDAGVTVVQYRNKAGCTRIIYEEALELKKICSSARFIINDRVDIALAVDADGVHIGRKDMPYEAARDLLGKSKIIGMSVHSMGEALEAEKQGADYLGVGPIFATTTKRDIEQPCGTSLIREIKKVCKIPVAAIGGIDLDNAGSVIEAGADAICAISAVITKSDVRKEIEKFQALFIKEK
ncbi:MAG: thiamine phosphate synthase [Candidatus Aureabacteria bacterium]|nr:thiamine phosphate synthase [Candidatus Auribacterota bacterium]